MGILECIFPLWVMGECFVTFVPPVGLDRLFPTRIDYLFTNWSMLFASLALGECRCITTEQMSQTEEMSFLILPLKDTPRREAGMILMGPVSFLIWWMK